MVEKNKNNRGKIAVAGKRFHRLFLFGCRFVQSASRQFYWATLRFNNLLTKFSPLRAHPYLHNPPLLIKESQFVELKIEI